MEPACLLLNAVGVTLRRLGEDALTVAASLAPDRLPGNLVLTSSERTRLRELQRVGFVEREHEQARRLGFEILNPCSPAYPKLLRQIPDPPLALYVKGSTSWLSQPAVAIVGSRNATLYGKSAAEALASQLALRGLTIVSGLARGIDAAAHRATLKSGGGTVAVLGCGGDIDYPRGHEELRHEIIKRGCLVTEFPFDTSPEKQRFPQRNRIISGLSLGVVVVEAQEHSGALVTARHALEQDREVFAVPGNMFAPTTRGPHQLLKDGAKLTEGADDILQELQGQFSPLPLASSGSEPASGTVEARVYAALGPDPVHVDELSRRLALPMSQLMSVLSLLELKRCVRQQVGKQFSRL